MANRIGVVYLGKMVETGPATGRLPQPGAPVHGRADQHDPAPEPAHGEGPEHDQVRGELPSAANPPSGCRFRTRCALAEDVCATAEPLLRLFGPDHYAACHFPLQRPIAADATPAAGQPGDSVTKQA